MSIEAMKLALEALEYAGPSWAEARKPAAYALRAAIEQAERQPHKVSLHEFLIAVKDKENLIGIPMICAEWPNREENNG